MPAGQAIVEDVMGRLTGALTDIATRFEKLAEPVSKFVDALSPGTVQVFGLAMRDLTATIGVALLPVMQVLTDGVQRAAGVLLPAMEHLQPAFRSLTDALMSFMLPTVQIFAHKMAGIADIVQVVAEALKVLGDLFGVISVIVLSAKDAISAFVNSLIGGGGGGGLADTLKNLKDAIYRVMIALLGAAASIAKAFGADSFVNALISNLKELTGAKGGVGGAAQNLAFKDFEQIGKDMALAAAQASEGGGQSSKDIRDYAKDAIANLENIAKNGTSLDKFLTERLPHIIQAAIKSGFESVRATASEAVDNAKSAAGAAASAAATGFRRGLLGF